MTNLFGVDSMGYMVQYHGGVWNEIGWLSQDFGISGGLDIGGSTSGDVYVLTEQENCVFRLSDLE